MNKKSNTGASKVAVFPVCAVTGSNDSPPKVLTASLKSPNGPVVVVVDLTAVVVIDVMAGLTVGDVDVVVEIDVDVDVVALVPTGLPQPESISTTDVAIVTKSLHGVLRHPSFGSLVIGSFFSVAPVTDNLLVVPVLLARISPPRVEATCYLPDVSHACHKMVALGQAMVKSKARL